jgi:hypothetical protein
MKKFSLLFGVIALLGLFSLSHAQDFVPGQIMIDIKHEYLPITPTANGEDVIIMGLPSTDSLNVLYGVYDFETPVDTSSEVSKGFYLLKFPDSLDVNEVLSSYLADIHINMGSLNYIRQPHGITPSDYYYPQQWGLRKMECPDAWRYSLGSSSFIIQIIDGGTDYGHPDLVHNIWQNIGEDWDGDGHTLEWDPAQSKWVLDPGDTLYHYDDDLNGYANDLVGWNFSGDPPEWEPNLDPDCKPRGFYTDDHGDHTAGTAAAVTDNYLSVQEATHVCNGWRGTVAGTAWFSKIMAARVSGYYISHAAAAIAYGVDNGAKIISMSWGYDEDWATLRNAINSAWDAGLLLVASAGNYNSETPHYPATYPNVIAVAATNSNDVKEGYSNYGTWVDICAPGDNWGPGREPKWWRYCYSEMGGTSTSAPFVAGMAALIWTCYPESSNTAIRTALINSADDIYGIPGNYPYIGKLGSGRANAYNAVRYYGAEPRPSGDCNGDRMVNSADITFLINYLYKYGPSPNPLCIADVNDDGAVSSADIVYLISYLYKHGPAPLDGCN